MSARPDALPASRTAGSLTITGSTIAEIGLPDGIPRGSGSEEASERIGGLGDQGCGGLGAPGFDLASQEPFSGSLAGDVVGDGDRGLLGTSGTPGYGLSLIQCRGGGRKKCGLSAEATLPSPVSAANTDAIVNSAAIKGYLAMGASGACRYMFNRVAHAGRVALVDITTNHDSVHRTPKYNSDACLTRGNCPRGTLLPLW